MAIERNTKQKEIIYEALKTLDHPTATEVFAYVHEHFPNVSRATVFRVLSGFSERGRAMELRLAGNEVRYDYNTEKHYHVRCRCCGRVADVRAEVTTPALGGLGEQCGFAVDGVSVEFLGTCSSCVCGAKTGAGA